MRNPLLRDITFALAGKLAALTVIYLLFFGAAHQPRIDQARMASWMLGADASRTAR